MLKKIRIILAAIVFSLITLVFLDFTGVISPHLAWIAKLQLVPALLAANFIVIAFFIVITLVFGRMYCSIMCPLGVFQDLISALHGKFKKNRFSFSLEKKYLRYTFLIIFILALIFGFSAVVSLLDPYAFYGRIASNLLEPIYLWVNNILALIAKFFNSYLFYSSQIWVRGMLTFLIAIGTLMLIIILSWLGGRTYCNTVCPVGTVLGYISKFSIFKVRLNQEKCGECQLCSRNCKASAIDIKNKRIDHTRCVNCFNCIQKCKTGALDYGLSIKGKSSPKKEEGVDQNRRAFLLGATLAGASIALSKEKQIAHGGLAVIQDKIPPQRHTPILPPGAISLKNLSKHCSSCQLCITACPNNVLRPATDLSHLMQPRVSFERGYCSIECNECSKVCPTSAIKPIKLEEKSSLVIGRAIWIKKNCVVLRDKVKCDSCFRHCPTGAISLVPMDIENGDSPLIPAIDETSCIGCGKCENLCPARPFSAIYVEGYEEQKEN